MFFLIVFSFSFSALVGSLTIGTTFFVSPVSGVLTDAIGLQRTTFLGGLIASSGMLMSSFVTNNVEALYFTYGIMYGIGGALAYTPSLTILGHYFRKYLGIVNGVVTAGSSTFTMLLSYLMAYFLKSFGLIWTLRLLALLACGIMVCALLFKPANDLIRNEQKRKTSKKRQFNLIEAFNVSIWKNKQYLVWALVIPIALFGYFVPYVHMLKFVEDNYSSDYDGKLPVICIGITSGLGRLIFGYIADMPRVNRILLQQISFLGIGLLTILLPSTKGNFYLLICIALFMGLFDGCFISLLGPIAFDICGQDGAAQAIGFLLGLCSFPLTIGPCIAGILYDNTKSYDLAFRLAGIPPLLGAFAMCTIRYVRANEKKNIVDVDDEDVVEKNRRTCDPILASAGRLNNSNTLSQIILDSEECCNGQRHYKYTIL